MNYFQSNDADRPALHATAHPGDYPVAKPRLAGVQNPRPRDILWNQPIFKAPALPIPQIAHEPLPLRATRITRRAATSA